MSVIVPRTRARIEVKYVLGNKSLDYEEVGTLIQDALNESLEDTIFETETWIDIPHIPKRSGDLIKSLKHFLNRSRPPPSTVGEVRGIRLVVGVGADIPYAKYVNEMTKAKVRHTGTWFEHSGKRAYSKGKPVFLDDPRAEGFFFDKLVDYAVERFKTNLSKAKYKLQNTTALTSRGLSQLEVT